MCHGYLCSTGAPARCSARTEASVQMSSPLLRSQGKATPTCRCPAHWHWGWAAACCSVCYDVPVTSQIQSLSVVGPVQSSPLSSRLQAPPAHRARLPVTELVLARATASPCSRCRVVVGETGKMTNGVGKTGSPSWVVVSPLPDTNAGLGYVRRARCM